MIRIRTDDPPKDFPTEDAAGFEPNTKDTQIPAGNLTRTNNLLQYFKEQPSGYTATTLADNMKQKYGLRASELMARLNAERTKLGLPVTEWDKQIPVTIQQGPVDVGGTQVELGAGGRYKDGQVFMGGRYVQPSSFQPAYSDEWANTLAHEFVHAQDSTAAKNKLLPEGFETTHLRDPRRLDEALAQVLGNELSAYNLRQKDENKFHPMLVKNQQGDYDYNMGMQQLEKIVKTNPGVFVNANKIWGAFKTETPGNKSKEFETATKTIGGLKVSPTGGYMLSTSPEVA